MQASVTCGYIPLTVCCVPNCADEPWGDFCKIALRCIALKTRPRQLVRVGMGRGLHATDKPCQLVGEA